MPFSRGVKQLLQASGLKSLMRVGKAAITIFITTCTDTLPVSEWERMTRDDYVIARLYWSDQPLKISIICGAKHHSPRQR